MLVPQLLYLAQHTTWVAEPLLPTWTGACPREEKVCMCTSKLDPLAIHGATRRVLCHTYLGRWPRVLHLYMQGACAATSKVGPARSTHMARPCGPVSLLVGDSIPGQVGTRRPVEVQTSMESSRRDISGHANPRANTRRNPTFHDPLALLAGQACPGGIKYPWVDCT